MHAYLCIHFPFCCRLPVFAPFSSSFLVTSSIVSSSSSSTSLEAMQKVLGIQRPSLSPLTVSDSFKSSRFPTLKCSALTSYSFDDFDKFKEACTKGNLIPLQRCIFSDHLTPVLAYHRLVTEDDRYAPSFLFESMGQTLDGSTMGLYSIIGAQPSIEIVANKNIVTIFDHHEGCMTQEIVDDPMVVPRRIMDGWKPQLLNELPRVFCGGWLGYFSYEKKKLPFSNAPPDDRNLPDVHLSLYEDILVFDHTWRKAHVIHWVRLYQYSSVEEAFSDGVNRLENLVSRVLNTPIPIIPAGPFSLPTHLLGSKLEASGMTTEEYKKAVLLAKEHIMAGDISQNVLSRCYPFDIYRALRIADPSPYMNYLQARWCVLVASSPEILTRVQMVSKFGSVKVEKLMDIERYSHVMHICSTITGVMLDDLNSWDVLRAALPVGPVSGVPKVKAMELIDQLEYGGGVGAISFSGEMDIGFALATIVFPQNLD